MNLFRIIGMLMMIAIPLILLFAIGALVVAAISSRGRRRAVGQAGPDPLASDAPVAGRLPGSPALAPGSSVEARLGELAELRERGVITPDEYAEARRKVLDSA